MTNINASICKKSQCKWFKGYNPAGYAYRAMEYICEISSMRIIYIEFIDGSVRENFQVALPDECPYKLEHIVDDAAANGPH